jgi:hypothetical protein
MEETHVTPEPEQSEEAVPDQPRKRRSTKVALIAVVAIPVVLVAGAALTWAAVSGTPDAKVSASPSPVDPPLVAAQKWCAPNSPYARIGDGGKSLIVSSAGKKQPGVTTRELDCFWLALKVTDAIQEEMGSTRALDGRQEADWDQFHGSWNYHPDNGFEMIVTMR